MPDTPARRRAFRIDGRIHRLWLLACELQLPRVIWRPLCWRAGRHDPWTERPHTNLYCIVCHKDLPLDYATGATGAPETGVAP